MPADETQGALRRAFGDRGLPRGLRVDNGPPWGSRGDLPTDLVLWLAGLGVEVRANPPRRPQDNGVVERSQGTGKRWAEPHRTATADELQGVIDAMDRRQRRSYPYRGSEGRMAAHPGLEHSGRAYDEALEPTTWDPGRVDELLTRFVVGRRVDRSGSVSVYNRNLYVGRRYMNSEIFLSFDPQQRRWLFHDASNHLLNHHPAGEIDAERIRTLTVTNRRDRS